VEIIRDKIVTTRKRHKCSACGRFFDKGTQMRTQVNTFDSIQTWRECPTCHELISKHGSHFVDEDGIYWMNCVNDALTKNQTPEQLLDSLNSHKSK
jgi:hypothetical protein